MALRIEHTAMVGVQIVEKIGTLNSVTDPLASGAGRVGTPTSGTVLLASGAVTPESLVRGIALPASGVRRM